MSKNSNCDPIKIAIAGLGRAGWDIHIRQLRDRKDFAITDVIDIAQDRLDKARDELACRTYQNWKQFLRNGEAELVVIATQSKDHAPMSIDALKAGYHVLVEKPIATRWRDVDRIINAAKTHQRLLTIHQNHRLDPDFMFVNELIRSGVLGRVFSIRRGVYDFSRRNDWQVLRKYGGGQLNNWGVHLVDQVLQLLDSPVKDVLGSLQQIVNPGDVEDHVEVKIRAQSGQTAHIEVTSACALPLPTWVIMGTKGTLRLDDKMAQMRCYQGSLPEVSPVDITGVPDRTYGFNDKIEWQEKTMPVPTANRWQDFYGYLYGTLREGKSLFVTPESVRQTMWVLHQARKGTEFGEQRRTQ